MAEKRRKLTGLGYVLCIGGMLLAVTLYVLTLGEYFADLQGTFGLNEVSWALIGGVIWVLVLMAVLAPVILKVGMKTE